jgi:hypothetical protein
LPGGYNLGDHLAAFAELAVDKVTNPLARQERRDQGTGEVGAATGFFGDAKEQTM